MSQKALEGRYVVRPHEEVTRESMPQVVEVKAENPGVLESPKETILEYAKREIENLPVRLRPEREKDFAQLTWNLDLTREPRL